MVNRWILESFESCVYWDEAEEEPESEEAAEVDILLNLLGYVLC